MALDMFWVLMGALIVGIIIGAIPGFFGAMRGKIGLGLLGFVYCVVSGLALGALLAIPVAIVFVYFIQKNKQTGIR
jgi:hypothetical protein